MTLPEVREKSEETTQLFRLLAADIRALTPDEMIQIAEPYGAWQSHRGASGHRMVRDVGSLTFEFSDFSATATPTVEILAGTVRELARAIERLEQIVRRQNAVISCQMTSLAVENLEVIRPIQITIRPDDEEYIATFFDASLGMTGDTPEDAFESLRSMIAELFQDLVHAQPDTLGPHPTKQLRTLGQYIRCQN